MVKNRRGKEWTKDEDRQLKDLFFGNNSFKEMGDKLGRTWFACKCRLARLKLIPPFKTSDEYYGLIGSIEPYRIPHLDFEIVCGPDSDIECHGCVSSHIDSEDTSNTFSNAELNIITDWLKTRLSNVVCKLADGEHCLTREVELRNCKEFLETEIQVANNMKKMTIAEREKVLRRLC